MPFFVAVFCSQSSSLRFIRDEYSRFAQFSFLGVFCHCSLITLLLLFSFRLVYISNDQNRWWENFLISSFFCWHPVNQFNRSRPHCITFKYFSNAPRVIPRPHSPYFLFWVCLYLLHCVVIYFLATHFYITSQNQVKIVKNWRKTGNKLDSFIKRGEFSYI